MSDNRAENPTGSPTMSGVEALVQGALEAGVKVVASYPGFPITGFVEGAMKLAGSGLRAEWTANEKVAVETALGASLAGTRAVAAMKQAGLNAAADAVVQAAYYGVRAGLVILVGDDPGCSFSPIDTDSRHLHGASHLPILEPWRPGQARAMMRRALEVSERFSEPVIIRIVTGFLGTAEEPDPGAPEAGERGAGAPLVMCDVDAITGHYRLHDSRDELLAALAEFCEEDNPGASLGVVAGGFLAGSTRAALKSMGAADRVSLLKLGLYPPPPGLLESFVRGKERVLVLEQSEPYLEYRVRQAARVPVLGKLSATVRQVGEVRGEEIRDALAVLLEAGADPAVAPPKKLRTTHMMPLFDDPWKRPVMCPGCPGLGIGYALKRLKQNHDFMIFADQGCSVFLAMPPFAFVDYVPAMGSTPGLAHGACLAGRRAVAVIGDSAFAHTGVQGLMSGVFNDTAPVIVVFDNLATAMSGRQENPSSGRPVAADSQRRLKIEEVARGCGAARVQVFNPLRLEEAVRTLEQALNADEAAVLIARSPCPLIPGVGRAPVVLNREKCTMCRECVDDFFCAALNYLPEKDRVEVAPNCNGCGMCLEACPEGALAQARKS